MEAHNGLSARIVEEAGCTVVVDSVLEGAHITGAPDYAWCSAPEDRSLFRQDVELHRVTPEAKSDIGRPGGRWMGTLRGESGLHDEPQHELMGRITGGLLDCIDVPWEYFPAATEEIDPALRRAQAHFAREQRPFALVMRNGTMASRALPDRQASKGAARNPGEVLRPAPAGTGERPTRGDALRRILVRRFSRARAFRKP